jgi:hypothetical protein
VTTQAGYGHEGKALSALLSTSVHIDNVDLAATARAEVMLAILDEMREANVARVALLEAIGTLNKTIADGIYGIDISIQNAESAIRTR